jgi:hypothetical protein
VLASVVGADRPERGDGVAREFLRAKQHAERRLGRLALPSTILRFGRLTDDPGNGRIDTVVRAGAPLTTSRDDAALAIAEALERRQRQRLDGVESVGDSPVAVDDVHDLAREVPRCRSAWRRPTTRPTIPR